MRQRVQASKSAEKIALSGAFAKNIASSAGAVKADDYRAEYRVKYGGIRIVE
jgi:hypothetical protein